MKNPDGSLQHINPTESTQRKSKIQFKSASGSAVGPSSPPAVGKGAATAANGSAAAVTATALSSGASHSNAHKEVPLVTPQYTEAGVQVPVGNGGIGPGSAYVWTQTLQDCTVHIPVTPQCASRDVKVRFTVQGLDLVVSPVGGGAQLQGILGGDVTPSECLWTLDRGQHSCTLTVTLEKCTETWWRSVLEGHPQIDAGLVDSTRHVSEYDDETQATIRKLMVSVQRAAPRFKLKAGRH
jgi:hypothetical protein